jgi:hypothetical protein
MRAFFPLFGDLAAGGLLCVALLLAGCNTAGSKQESLYQRLSGDWRLERLEGGGFDYSATIAERYPSGVRLTFQEADGGRTYTIVGRAASDSLRRIAKGRVVLPGENVLGMTSGFSREVTWRYRFPTSTRVLFEGERGSRTFLAALLPGGGQTQDVQMTLARTER